MQQLVQNAYRQTQNVAESPRQTEYRLFAQVTKALMDADGGELKMLAEAVIWNRRLWSTLQADCAQDENRLPDQVRAGIISLAIWVDKHSRKVLRREAPVQPLITVNRTIMDGLAQTPEMATAEPAAVSA